MSEEARKETVRRIFALWDESATHTAADAVRDMFADWTEDVEQLLGPLLNASLYWTEQVARSILGLPSDQTEDFETLAELLKLEEQEDDSLTFAFEQPIEDRIAAFNRWIEFDGESPTATLGGREVSIAVLRESLGECEVVLPDEYCDMFDIAHASTYSTAVRAHAADAFAT